MHHIIPYNEIKSHDEYNLITLCRECHKKTYNKEWHYESLFQGILYKKYANGENLVIGNPVPPIIEAG